MTNNIPTILAIETATSSCSVALSYADGIFTRNQVGSNIHSKVLLEMVKEVLAQAQIDNNQIQAVAVGQGPGSFTGLRIGVGVAQGIAYGINAPMIGVSSLDALANQAPNQGRVIAGIDARMGEVYWCEYVKSNDGVLRIGDLKVSAPVDIVSDDLSVQVQLVGNAWPEYETQFSRQLIENGTVVEAQTYPMADSLLQLAEQAYLRGELINAIDFAPEYVRNDVAKKSTKNKKSLIS